MSRAIVEGHFLVRREADPYADPFTSTERPWHIATADSCGDRTFCDRSVDYGWERHAEKHPEDACGERGGECAVCFTAYRARRSDARLSECERFGSLEHEDRGEVKRYKARKAARARRNQPKPKQTTRQAERVSPAVDVFRMLRPELEALGTPEALAELQRRRAKRAAKRAERAA